MNSIYIKNYKGFREEIIPIVDVNFFVGENSTGKTSILKLINILTKVDFWLRPKFNTREVELGFFDEILNKNCGQKSFFMGLEDTNAKEQPIKRILIEFIGKDNIPQVSKIKITSDKHDIVIHNTRSGLFYSHNLKKEQSFYEWANDLKLRANKKKYKENHAHLPVGIIINIIEREITKSKPGRIGLGFTAHVLFSDYLWIAPIRAKAKRIYESYDIEYSPEGSHIPFLIRKLFRSQNKADKLKSFLESFGKESKLFDTIEIKELGTDSSSPFGIDVLYDNTPIKLSNVGYGVSQSLPLVIEILSNEDTVFSIQQPEVHLHPKAQAAFGSLIFNSYCTSKNKFIIETHSDYTINRFRHDLYKSQSKSISNSACQVLFFERNGVETKITAMPISTNGSFLNPAPDSYRDFFIDEELKLLEL